MAKFVVSASHHNHYPNHPFPEFALVGPSNAGKSSLINSLAASKIALISNKPGKTRALNFYDFSNFYLVDTPGYGFASGSKNSVASLSRMLDSYFLNRECVLGVFHICSSHPLSDKDKEVMKYLTSRFHNYRLLINKVDKLNQSELNALKMKIKDVLPLDSIIFFSSKTKLNIPQIMGLIKSWINGK